MTADRLAQALRTIRDWPARDGSMLDGPKQVAAEALAAHDATQAQAEGACLLGKLGELKTQMTTYPWSSGSALLLLDEIIASLNGPRRVSDDEVRAWVERHDFGASLSLGDYREMVEDARTIELAAGAPNVQPKGTVPMPTNEDEAVGMALVGEAWLREHAPHRLKPTQSPAPAPETADTRDEDDLHTIERAADLLEGYAAYIRNDGADNLQYHPYLPELDMIAEELRMYATKMDVLAAELDTAIRERDEARQEPWPEWTTNILKMVREVSGYDGHDDAEGVDVEEEVRELIAELTSQIERLRASQAPAVGAEKRVGAISVRRVQDCIEELDDPRRGLFERTPKEKWEILRGIVRSFVELEARNG